MSNPLSSDKERITSAGRRLAHAPDFDPVPPLSLTRLGGGRNSRVYLVESSNGSKYVAKRYFRHNNDSRDRLATEFNSLRHMWRHGLRSVPRPLAMDAINNLAFFEYLPGRALESREITPGHIDQLCNFLFHINKLKDKDGSRNLAPASEACFSVEMAMKNLRLRLKRLEAVEETSPGHARMKAMIEEDFIPLLDDTQSWLTREPARDGLGMDTEIPWSDRTLSPSDYGFHNALCQNDGRLVFLDFEYFGWDDPAKMILDFLLHPAIDLTRELKKHFLDNMLELLDATGGLRRRIGYYQVVFGLKWVLILLNEFQKTDFDRRQFAGITQMDRTEVLSIQLEKARRQLEWTRGVYGKTEPAF